MRKVTVARITGCVVFAALALATLGCDKRIHEARSPIDWNALQAAAAR